MKRSINDWKQRKIKKNKQLKKIARSQVERREAGRRRAESIRKHKEDRESKVQ